MDNLALLVASRLSSFSSSSLSPTSRSTDQSNYSRKLETLSDPVTTRSDKHACGKPMLTDHDKQATGNRQPADETNKEDPTQGILVWLQPFRVNPGDLETHVLAHSSARAILRFGRRRFKSGDTKNGSTVFMVTSAKKKKQKRSFCEQKKVWWLDNSRARNPQRRTGISEQSSPIRCRSTSSRHSMKPCQTKTSQETEKDLRKLAETAAEAKS